MKRILSFLLLALALVTCSVTASAQLSDGTPNDSVIHVFWNHPGTITEFVSTGIFLFDFDGDGDYEAIYLPGLGILEYRNEE